MSYILKAGEKFERKLSDGRVEECVAQELRTLGRKLASGALRVTAPAKKRRAHCKTLLTGRGFKENI